MLIYDPINQGERDQYWHLENRNAVASCTHAHNMMGKQLELVGDFFGMWRVWDVMRALDYFLARPEVNTTRLGLTGNSSGGTVSECSSELPDLVPLYGLNPRGLGESRPDDADLFHPYGMDYLFHGHALMLGESYLG